MARAIMLQGTGSDVGKSVLVAGLCRAARNRGLTVRPFKPQNMSNNAAIAGIPGANMEGEIGRAQWLQALACGVRPTVHMNPVLLKPQSDLGAQVVVQGRVFGEAKASAYGALKEQLLAAVMDSWRKLGEGADLVIVEGAGSPAEINLRDRDIANMGFATRAGVPVILVGDIDRGGVIAALAGTHLILPEGDRAAIEGFIINKFRGDVSLFDAGLSAITRFTGWRSFGVVPWLPQVAHLPPEDAVALDRRAAAGTDVRLRIAVPMLSRIANFDDLDPLGSEPGVEVVFVPPGRALPRDADLIVLPGTKSTVADMGFLRAQGWDEDILRHHGRGGSVIGLCGGFQMLGRLVRDPEGHDGAGGEEKGLGLLDVDTVMAAEKQVRGVMALSVAGELPISAYEIHMGRTSGPDCARPVALVEGRPEGATSADGRVWGTYLHGIFTADAYRRAFLAGYGVQAASAGYRERLETALDGIADALEQHLDCTGLFALAR
ncbi:cobyric acid synthase [Nitratireductor thuwali]|uniref:Cobyric acid synthase n=1 Tax=Nitratireductor thuwali TaxID=2267699 RepID=A0ABY5MGJ1_9HYPH|nr:Cobyric acid synthase [Nitratireductor thuwali]